MRSEEELWTLLREATGMPYGSGQIALLEQIIQHADAGGHDGLRFAARMQATTAYVHGGEPAKSFVTFSWCRAEYDRHPERFDHEDESLLLWHFKYMANGLTKFPEVPLSRTYDVLDDMERRFRLGGHSLHAVYAYRWLVAEHIGDPAAEEWYQKWSTAPRDENSDCIGCDPTSKVDHLAARGRDEEAVALAAPVLAGQLTCSEQPQSILTELLLPYLRTGRLAEAADAHRRAYRRLRGNLADLGTIGTHVAFCALTGNEPRGLEIVERHVGWLDHPPSPHAAMWFAASAALLLRRLAEGGHAGLSVRRHGVDVPVGELGEQLAAMARGIAERFDKRNGTTRVGDAIADRLIAPPLVEHLPLNAVDGAIKAPAVGVARRAERAEELPEGPDALLDHAERLLRLRRPAEARTALARFDSRWPEAPDHLVARRLDLRSMVCSVDNRYVEAQEAAVRAAELHRAAGRDRDALISEARAAWYAAAFAVAQDDEEGTTAALGDLTGLTDRLAVEGDPDQRAGARLRLARALGHAGRVHEALAVLEEVEQPDDSLLVAEVETQRGHALLMLERHEEARTVAARARRAYAELDDPPAAAIASLVHGYALANLDELDPAADAFDAAVRLTDERDVRLSALVGRGRARLAGGQPVEAITDLVEAVADHVSQGEDGPAAILRFDLAVAYHATGQLLDAAETAESAVDVLDRLGAQEPADRTRYLLSRVYRELAEPDQALALLTTLANNLDGFDNLPVRGQMHEEAAQILYQVDRDAQAADRFVAAADAYRAAGLPLDELRVRRWRAVSLRWAGDAPAAAAALAEADALASTLEPGDPQVAWELAMLDFDAARVHIGGEELDLALQRLTGVATAFREIEAFGEALHADLLHGELLLRRGQPADAEVVLRSVLGAAPQDSQARENSAWLLCEALEQLGRSPEAEAIRREHLGE